MKRLLQNSIKKILKRIKIKLNPEIKIERFVPTEKIFLNKKIYIHDINSFNMCYNELFLSEAYNFKAKNDKPHIVDCGANLGMSIIYFKEIYPNCSIIAFEADNYIFSFLEKNIESFGYENIELINEAVWNKDEELMFLAEGGAGGRIEKNNDIQAQIFKKVQATSLKKYLINRKVDFLKIDIEGAEYQVLVDCANEIKGIDFMFIEYHSMIDKNQNLHEILEIIKNAGFRYHIKEAYTTKYPFIVRDLNFGMDLQLNIFCYKN